MKLVFYLCLISCLLSSSCNSKSQKNDYNKAEQLNERALSLGLLGDTIQIMEAIQLLNEATNIQPDYYAAYWNKLTFQRQLGLIDDIFLTLKAVEQFRSKDPYLKTQLGAFYELYKGDTIRGKIRYEEADLLFISILDTINPNSIEYEGAITSYALNLKLLGREEEANRILCSHIKNYDEEYDEYKLLMETFIKSTRKELLNTMVFGNGFLAGADL